MADVRTQDAVLRRLETLADAAAHLSHELRARHPEIPWRQVMDFRNVLAHAYTEIRRTRSGTSSLTTSLSSNWP